DDPDGLRRHRGRDRVRRPRLPRRGLHHRPDARRALTRPPQPPRAGPREVLALAVPAFLALVAEPLFLMVDAAIVGRLGVIPLAGLGTASSVLLTAAG